MKMVEIESTNLCAVGYDPEKRELCVSFKSNPKTRYSYANVEPEVFSDFMQAKSKGSFFHSQIRTKYTWIKDAKQPSDE